ncbi:RNA-directed DNA polymerase [Chondrocystis sp. NIES-4102]|nr:RNA-directed DNA polymerase [Chondrocystis sp. NIES-4102]
MMESRMTRNCHVRFGERYEETHQSQDWKVRFVPTLLSPLLANIALHGMETVLTEWVKTWKGCKRDNLDSFSFVKYADDFVCLHESKEVIESAKEILSEFLKPIGLQLKPEKTQIVHTLDTNRGFDFLGFNVRQYTIQNGKTDKRTGVKRGYKILIKPSNKAIKRYYEKIAKTVRNNKAAKQENLILILNPIIKGWCNYHSLAVSKEIFSKLDHLFTVYCADGASEDILISPKLGLRISTIINLSQKIA